MKLSFFLSLESVCKNLTFCVTYIFRISFLNIKSFTPEESQDKTGIADIKKNYAVVWGFFCKSSFQRTKI